MLMDRDAIIGAVNAVTKKWAKQRRAEERRASSESRRAYIFSDRAYFTEAAWAIIPDAYMKASANNTLPAHARQIMYAARGPIQEEVGRPLGDKYFCQTLLPDYLRAHPHETADWDVVFDARGHFTEPHTGLVVPLGTLDVRHYLRSIETHDITDLVANLNDTGLYPTGGPGHRFQAILFIEKEGFMPLFSRVLLAERYDLAIMSTKGLSVTASRMLVDALCWDIPLLVLHDFDKAGFSIAGTLQRNTRRYEFRNRICAVDLGLRLADVQANGLQSEEVHYGKSNPRYNLEDNSATKAEIAFLCRGGDRQHGYTGQRVELNAFTSEQLVAWIERKLKEHGISKVVPDKDTLAGAYRRAVKAERMRALIRKAEESIRDEVEKMAVPGDLEDRVLERMRLNPALSWDAILNEFATGADQ
jgi:hypothetical protein